MKCVVFAGLSDVKLKDKLMPLLSARLFSEIHVFRDTPGKPLPCVVYHSVPKSLRFSPLTSILSKLLFGLHFAIREKPNIIAIVTYYCIPYGLLGYIVSRVTGHALYTSLIGDDVHNDLYSWLFRLIILTVCKRSKKVITTGTVSARAMMSFGLQNTAVVMNTIDTGRFSLATTPRERKRELCFVGRLTPNKRVDRVLRLASYAGIMCDDVRASIIGSGECKSQLEIIASNLGISESVDFMGYRSDVNLLLREHLILCVFSENEGFPAVIAEALCSGVYVFAVGAGDIRDISEEESPLFVYNEEWNIEFFSTKLCEIKNFPHGTGLLRREAERFRQIFSYQRGGNAWKAVFHDCF